MRRACHGVFAVLIGLSVGVVAAAQVEESPVTIVHAGSLLTVPGFDPLPQQSVIVRGKTIAEVRDGFVTAADLGMEETEVTVIDLSDRFVLPGLTDLHTHVTGELGPTSKLDAVTLSRSDVTVDGTVFLRRTLDAGFTTIRDVGADPEVIFALRRGVADGKLAGPRILAAGAAISGTGGHADIHGYRQEILDLFEPDSICDGADDCRRAVREQVKRGSDWIKITATGGVLSETASGVNQQLFPDELAAIVQTAAMMGRQVAAHAHGTDGINAALEAGVATIEHGTFSDARSFELFKEKGAYLVPTMLAGATVTDMATNADFMPPAIRDKALAVGPQMLDMVRAAHEAGVAIAFGTDSGVSHHGDNAREFALLVEAGLSPMEAIETATVTAADVLGVSDVAGTIEPGKQADLIATAGSPLDDIEQLQHVVFVMKDGTVYQSAAP
jgi:imidazolonepropionase-like amidohydrolase